LERGKRGVANLKKAFEASQQADLPSGDWPRNSEKGGGEQKGRNVMTAKGGFAPRVPFVSKEPTKKKRGKDVERGHISFSRE